MTLSSCRREAGFSLIEVVIALLLLGTGVAAIVAALQVGATSAVVQRDRADAERVLRAASEQVKAAQPFIACVTESQVHNSYLDGFDPGDVVVSAEVAYWDGTLGSSSPFSGSCPGVGQAVQRIRLVATINDMSVGTTVVKRAGA